MEGRGCSIDSEVVANGGHHTLPLFSSLTRLVSCARELETHVWIFLRLPQEACNSTCGEDGTRVMISTCHLYIFLAQFT